jgi:hypothetical protein
MVGSGKHTAGRQFQAEVDQEEASEFDNYLEEAGCVGQRRDPEGDRRVRA